ncbi:MAG: hypothetical protein JXX29_17910 [Deltaproteobacteria bacterium]|nr:hypothetical protein [Deltaproteobacteria bacterium]MBN2673562.1 hypothetical protein [Deltaproteobacteria bacterium]
MNTAKLLLSEKLITKNQYEQAYLDNMAHGATIGFHLIQSGAVSSEAMVTFQMERFGLKRRKKNTLNTIPGHVIRKITRYLANKYRVLPISTSADVLLLGITEPTNDKAMDMVANYTAMAVQPILVSEDDMTWALNRYFNSDAQNAARDTMPLANKERQGGGWDDDDAPRDTISWGVNIEDALSRAVTVSAKQTDRNLLSVVPPPPPREPTKQPKTVESQTHSSIPPKHSAPPQKEDSGNFGELPPSEEVADQLARTSISIPPPHMPSQDERPTIIPGAPPHGGGVDSWTDTTPATELQEQVSPALRSYLPPSVKPSIGAPGAPRVSILPPHKTHARTEGELLHAVITTNSRDEIISLALEYMLRFAGRALFFIVKKTEIRGFHIAGEYTNRESVRSFWIPFNTRSTLGQVATSGLTYLGPIGRKPADAVFCAALGGRPSHALVVPIILKNRTVGILFADRVQTQEIAWPRLNRLTEAITGSLNRFIQKEHNAKSSHTSA